VLKNIRSWSTTLVDGGCHFGGENETQIERAAAPPFIYMKVKSVENYF